MTKIYEFSTTDLIDELSGRFENFVVMGIVKNNVHGDEVLFDWHGDEVVCIEMCADLIKEIREPESDDEEDD